MPNTLFHMAVELLSEALSYDLGLIVNGFNSFSSLKKILYFFHFNLENLGSQRWDFLLLPFTNKKRIRYSYSGNMKFPPLTQRWKCFLVPFTNTKRIRYTL